jgi:hypothetical protein
MSLREVKDTVNSRFKQRQNDNYALSSLIRVAVLSCFSENVRFPDPPYTEDKEGDWRNSKRYMDALSKIHKGGAKN